MDALQAYTSDFSGAESDGSGEEQPKSVAAEAAEDVEMIAELLSGVAPQITEPLFGKVNFCRPL